MLFSSSIFREKNLKLISIIQSHTKILAQGCSLFYREGGVTELMPMLLLLQEES